MLIFGTAFLCMIINVAVQYITWGLFSSFVRSYAEARIGLFSEPLPLPTTSSESTDIVGIPPKLAATASPALPGSLTNADYDQDTLYAIELLNTWFAAMTDNNYALADSIYRPGFEPERSETLRQRFIVTQGFLNQAMTELGPIQSFEVLNSYPGKHENQRIGLSKAYFSGGSICFRILMVSRETRWYIADWNWITPEFCKAEQARMDS